MKQTAVFLFTIAALFGCNADKKTITATPATIPDSSAKPAVASLPSYDTVRLKDITLTEKTVFENNRFAVLTPLSNVQFKKLSITSFDQARSTEYRYFIMDTLYAGNNIKALLIARVYPEENSVWLAVYDSTQQLTDHKQLYYDNAEGFLSIETAILNNKITVTTHNDFAETAATTLQKAVFRLNRYGKLEKK